MSKKGVEGVRIIPTVADERKAEIEKLKREMPDLLQSFELMAKINYAQYLGWIKAGFSEQQALELLKAREIK